MERKQTPMKIKPVSAARLIALPLILLMAISSAGCSGKYYDYDLNEYITLGQYKGIEVSKAEVDAQVESQLQKALENSATDVEITDRAIKNGDTANIDYKGTIDGVEFAGGSAVGSNVEIGSGQLIDGFEAGLIGKKIGDSFDLNLTFPADYQNPDVAGKKAKFAITVNKITEHVVPELTDATIAAMDNGFDTVDAYKAKLTSVIKQNMLMNQVVTSTVVKTYPEKELKSYYDNMVKYYEYYATMYGVTLSAYITSYAGTDVDTFLAQIVDNAKSSIKSEMVLEQIVRNEKITYTDEQYKKFATELATSYGYETLEAYEKATDKATIEKSVLSSVVLEFIEANSTEKA